MAKSSNNNEKDTKVISVRLDSDMYKFVRNKGEKDFNGITDYIKNLIKKETEI